MNPLPASLLASLWQAGAVWGVLHLLLRLIPATRCGLRYNLALAGLLLVAGCWAATWWQQAGASGGAGVAAPVAAPSSMQARAQMVEERTVFSAPPASQARISWERFLVLGWQLGVVLGIVRIVRAVRMARGIREESVPVDDPAWKRQLRELCEAMGQKLTVGLRASARVVSPVVMGLVRPVVILPASALTGVPAEILRAALAHEIAHIARWDYLANLVQMGIEALLFFNPFVWLISQGVRREREACCDRAASEVCRGSLAYSEALLWWSREPAGGASAALAIGAKEGGLLGRVRRLLDPAGAIGRPGGWWGGAGVAFLVPLFLVLSAVMIQATVSELSPQERVALMEFLAKPFRRPIVESEARAEPFSGIVRDDRGHPVAGASWWVKSDALLDPLQGTTGSDGLYAGKAPRGPVALIVRAKGFAPAQIDYGPADSREGASITLPKGLDLRVRCVDEEGRPIPGATVRASDGGIPYWAVTATTDEQGWASLVHLPERPSVTLTFDAAGFETARDRAADLTGSTPQKPYALVRTAPTRLVVVDEISREPVAGVRLRICGFAPQGAAFVYPNWSGGGLPTDANGEAQLDGLNQDLTYDMKAEGQDRATTFRLDPRHDNGRTILLPRERKLGLRIVHLPEQPGGKLLIQYSQWDTENSSSGGSVNLQVAQGEASVTLAGLMPKTVEIYLLGQWVKIPVLAEDVTEFTIDYDKIKPPPSVRVVIKAKVGRGQAPPKGAYWLNWALTETAGVWDGKSVPVRDGVAETELPAGSVFRLNNGSLVGGRVDEAITYHVSGTATTVEVPITPAGMIRAKVLESDGRLANDVFVMARDRARRQSPVLNVKNFANNQDAQEWFISDPIDLGARECQVVAASGLRYAVSRPFKIDLGNPIQDVVLTLPSSHPRSVRVVDENGASMPGVTLHFTMDVAPVDRIYGRTATTDANGIAWVDLGDKLPDKITASPISAIVVPARQPLDLSGGKEPVLVVRRGKKLAGRIVNHSKAGDLANCWVAWMRNEEEMSSEQQYVDAEGRFVFHNAPDHPVFLSISHPRGTDLKGDLNVRPGDPEIAIELVDGK